MNPDNYPLYLFAGLGLVTLIDAIGSVASRRFNFSYGYFSFLSFIAYTYIACIISSKTGHWLIAFISLLLIGFYDATVGWQISRRLNANYGRFEEKVSRTTAVQRLSGSMIFSIICTGIGVYLAETI